MLSFRGVQHLHQVCCLAAIRMQICHVRYVKAKRHSKLPRPKDPEEEEFLQEMQQLLNKGDPLGHQLTDDLEKMTDWADIERGTMYKDAIREQRRAQIKASESTIRHKYFKPPQEVNLLTWAAKEQIRFLNAEYPDEWTVDKIAESFPVTKEGAVKLLKSTFMPYNEQEIIRHDQRVKKHWEALTSGKEGGPVAPIYQSAIDSGRAQKLVNAGGIKSLPMPRIHIKEKLLPTEEKPLGPFGAIYKAFEDSKKQKEITEVLDSKEPLYLSSQNPDTSQMIDGNSISRTGKGTDDHNMHKLSTQMNHEVSYPSDRVLSTERGDHLLSDITRNLKSVQKKRNKSRRHLEKTLSSLDQMEEEAGQDHEHAVKSLFDVYEEKSRGTEEKKSLRSSLRRLRRPASQSHSYLQSPSSGIVDSKTSVTEEDEWQLKGTGKISKVDKNEIQDPLEIPKYSTEEFSKNVHDYNEQFAAGQQHCSPKGAIRIPSHKKKKGVVYQIRDCIYDDDGQFLYRLP